MILIGNLSHQIQPKIKGKRVRCDRKTPLGNPFDIRGKEALRDAACECFEEYCDLIINHDHEPGYAARQVLNKFRVKFPDLRLSPVWERPSRAKFLKEFMAIKEEDMLMCHCFPKRCHCESIRKQRMDVGDFSKVLQQGMLY